MTAQTTTTEDLLGILGVVAALGLVLVICLLTVRAILQAADHPAPTSLVVALSILTLVAIGGGISTNSNEAWTIAAAGVGALAGSVTAIFQKPHDDDDQPPKENP